MSKVIKCMILFCIIIFIAGCSNKNGNGVKGVSTASTVDKVINNQIDNENSKSKIAESEDPSVNKASTEDARAVISNGEGTQKEEAAVDYDLTQMNSDMVYATVYQMMVAPEEYEGKTFRIDGNFYATYYEATKKYYFYCVIQDATACCAQGMEFVWEDGSHIYPDEYPKDNEEIIVEGTFETYKEDGDENLYCRLSDAALLKKN